MLPEPDIDKDFGQDQEEEEVLPEPDIDKDFSQDQERGRSITRARHR